MLAAVAAVLTVELRQAVAQAVAVQAKTQMIRGRESRETMELPIRAAAVAAVVPMTEMVERAAPASSSSNTLSPSNLS
jgi:hypothetical protein